jgi:hypothetical protein
MNKLIIIALLASACQLEQKNQIKNDNPYKDNFYIDCNEEYCQQDIDANIHSRFMKSIDENSYCDEQIEIVDSYCYTERDYASCFVDTYLIDTKCGNNYYGEGSILDRYYYFCHKYDCQLKNKYQYCELK